MSEEQQKQPSEQSAQDTKAKENELPVVQPKKEHGESGCCGACGG